MMVELETGIVTGDPSGVASLGDHSHVSEMVQSAIDGGARDSGEAFFHGVEDLIGRRVVVEVEDRLEDDPALHRTALAAIAAEPLEKLDALCSCRLVQAAPRVSCGRR